MNIAKNVKHYRELAGLNQTELGEKVSCSGSMITYIEAGSKLPSVALLANIAKALDVAMDDLVAD
ncbi:MAG: helix-turn-helix transcriptional regulator [Oscillospiraceae bacterium]|nr:helix-turn-helix transcriptional regulator [Oscillospiraceae bacterium]